MRQNFVKYTRLPQVSHIDLQTHCRNCTFAFLHLMGVSMFVC